MFNPRYQDNILVQCLKREYQNYDLRGFERKAHTNKQFIHRLNIEHELKGHEGCVNCLDWSSCGNYLASGSDDCNIIVWDAKRKQPTTTIATNHEGNIFSVKFLPYSDNRAVASCAVDAVVKVFDVITETEVRAYQCHSSRTKKLATSQHEPHLLWSCSEDGTVRQYDMREAHTCSTELCCNVLVNLRRSVPRSEAKCIEVHPTRAEWLAVGANDQYIRMCDRRVIPLHSVETDSFDHGDGCVEYYACGHLLPYSGDLVQNSFVTTHIAFSPDGMEMLQNLGGEHIYSYNLRENAQSLVYEKPKTLGETTACKNGFSSTYETRQSCRDEPLFTELNRAASKLKEKGNKAFMQKNYYEAVFYYNEALRMFPNSSLLLANRAAALLHRKWNGDIYNSLRDSHRAVKLDPSHSKAYLRQIKCLAELQWYEEAVEYLFKFKELFPDQVNSSTLKKLNQEIAEGTMKAKSSSRQRKQFAQRHTKEYEKEVERCCGSYDFCRRYVGTRNVTTDIKEANYVGEHGKYIVAGSDCGYVFVWERATGNLVKAARGDEAIVNCLQPHPHTCVVATSGIDYTVKLWSPVANDEELPARSSIVHRKRLEELVVANQKNMDWDPFDHLLSTMGYLRQFADSSEDEGDEQPNTVSCATS